VLTALVNTLSIFLEYRTNPYHPEIFDFLKKAEVLRES
jgi:hypothetical protein